MMDETVNVNPMKQHVGTHNILQPIRACLPVLGLLLLSLLLAACADGERMRHDLAALQERNQADSLLTDSVLAMRLADYFDRHGTQNERLEAHYLLARTWADLGQAPRALHAFHRAAEQADTTRLDSLGCHHLSRIYGQMGELLIANCLPYQAIASLDKASFYAECAGEHTISNIFCSHKARCFYECEEYDSVLSVEEHTIRRFLVLGDTLLANTNMGPLAYCLVRHQNYQRARQCLQLYEYHSLYNRLSSADKWRLLNFYKGFYHQHIGNADSALFYFRKQLEDSSYPNNMALAYQGLYQVYHHEQQMDSAEKYAVMHAELSESISKSNATQTLLGLQHFYNYGRFQRTAEIKTLEAESARKNQLLLSLLVLVLVVALYLGYRHYDFNIRLTRQRMNAKYAVDILTYSKVRAELEAAVSTGIEQRRELEKELNLCKEKLASQQSDHLPLDRWNVAEALLNQPIVSMLHQYASQGKSVPDGAWTELRSTCNTFLPEFMKFLSSATYEPDLIETQLCILTKLRFLISEIGVLLELRPSTLSQKRRRLYKKFTGKDGSTADFDRYIRSNG